MSKAIPPDVVRIFGKNIVTYINLDGEDDVEVPFKDCHNLQEFIAMALHLMQQCGGELIINGHLIKALVMDQTNGYQISFQDIFKVNGGYRRLSEILKGDYE